MTEHTVAQQAERLLLRTAMGVLCMSLVYSAEALGYLVDVQYQSLLDGTQTGLSILAALIILPGFVRFARLRKAEGGQHCDADSYMGSVFQRACVVAFSVTFWVLVLHEPVFKSLTATLPVGFYLNSLLVISLGAFSASFFMTLWRDRQDDDALDLEG
jgi:hypothetical protein